MTRQEQEQLDAQAVTDWMTETFQPVEPMTEEIDWDWADPDGMGARMYLPGLGFPEFGPEGL